MEQTEQEEVKLYLGTFTEEQMFWIGVIFINHRIKAKVYRNETYASLMQRLTFVLGVEPEYLLSLKPVNDKDIQQMNISKEEHKKIKDQSDSQSCEDDPEEGEIAVPKNIAVNIEDLKPDQFYLVVYLRAKSDEEMQRELKEQQMQEEDDGEKSNRMSPRKKMMKKFQKQGININQCYQKAKRPRGDKRVLICPFVTCLKSFTETGNLKTHLRTHTGERPFQCPFENCDKQFITKGHLKTHELIHTGDKPFVCHTCGKSYSRSGRLKIHIRTHTGEKPFECPMHGCNKTFTEKGNLKTHLRIHSGEKPFQCQHKDCLKTFTTQGHLTDHMRRHSGERPFQCQFCNQAFMRSSTLKIHLRRHTGERPFQCDLCGKLFSESGNLKTHIKTHKANIKRIQRIESSRQLIQESILGKRKKSSGNLKVEQEVIKGNKHQPLKRRRNRSQLKKEEIQVEREAERIVLPLRLALHMHDGNVQVTSSSTFQMQQQQQYQQLNFGFTPKILNPNASPKNYMGHSPQGYSQFMGNTNYGFSQSLTNFQQPQLQSNSNQISTSASTNMQQSQGHLQMGNTNNGLSPTTNKGQQNTQNPYIFNGLSPMGMLDGNISFGGGSFGGYSPESRPIKNIIVAQPTIQNTQDLKNKSALENMKKMGSFNSITSLNELFHAQKSSFNTGVQSQMNNNFQQPNYNPQLGASVSRPLSHQGSIRDLLSLNNKHYNQKFDQQLENYGHYEGGGINFHIGQSTTNHEAATNLAKLQKQESVANLFSGKATAFHKPEIDNSNALNKLDPEDFSSIINKIQNQRKD